MSESARSTVFAILATAATMGASIAIFAFA